ncbi:MAG: ISLre2 family transposase [Symbiobacteriaceae bacterium]
MNVIRQLLEITLRLAQVVEKALLEAPDFRTLELEVAQGTQEAARQLLVTALEALDRQLMEQRDRRQLKCVNQQSRSLLTWFGEIQWERRYYQDRQSEARRFLLDEVLGLEPRQRYSPLVREFGIQLCTQVPFGAAADWLERVTCGAVRVSPMALWADVQAAGARADREAKAQRQAVFERGEIPAGGRPAAAVDLEFDELWVRGRRRGADGKKERIALMHALAYEGKATDERGRTVLQNRRVHVAVGEGTASIEEALAAFAAEWDWSRVGQCTVGGDGAPWIRKVLEYLPQASYRLDPFHLKRAIRRGLGHDAEAHRQLAEALAEGKPWSEVEAILDAARRRARGEARDRVRELAQYLQNQWDGIVADRNARRLGAIEAENYHVLARRMKRRGASWSERGARHLARLLAARANDELDRYARPAWRRRQAPPTALPQQRPFLRQRPSRSDLEDAAQWLRARIPALYGPHSDREWVRALRHLAGFSLA